jgi:hypothetical protein
MLNRAIDNKDAELAKLELKLGGHNNLVALKEKYHNYSLADQVLNKNETEKIIEVNNKLYRKYEPVFNIPVSKHGRADFYAPYKRIGNFLFETFWFNLAAIWFMTLCLYLTLQYNLLEKTINKIFGKMTM